MDLGVTDADWMSLRNGLHLAVVKFDSCSFTRTCNTLFSESCVDSPVLCRLSVLSCLLTPSYRLAGLAPAAAKCFCDKNCIRSISGELFSEWRLQLRTRIVNPDDLIRSIRGKLYLRLCRKQPLKPLQLRVVRPQHTFLSTSCAMVSEACAIFTRVVP